MGQLPYLTVDNVKIPQSIAIARFLAKRFNLAGSDDITQAKVDAVADTINDLGSDYGKKVYSVPAEKRDEAIKKFSAEDLPKHLGHLEKLVGMYGSNGHAVSANLTWVDLYMFDMVSMMHDKDVKILEKFPHVSKVKKTVEEHPKIAAYLKKRPVTSF